MTRAQRIVLAVLFICLLGNTGALIWGYQPFVFTTVGFVAIVVNSVWIARAGLRQPIPGREDLAHPEK
jgi:hypothetical protein